MRFPALSAVAGPLVSDNGCEILERPLPACSAGEDVAETPTRRAGLSRHRLGRSSRAGENRTIWGL